MKIGIIGVGNMGEALLAGILKGKKVKLEDITIYDNNVQIIQLNKKRYGVNTVQNYKDLLVNSDYLILAVKPNVYAQVLTEISPYLEQRHYIFSIAPGYDFNRLKKYLPHSFDNIVLFMSNTAAKIGKATTAAVFSDTISAEEKDKITDLFCSFGNYFEINEEQLPTITSVIGSAPAIVYMLLEGMIQGAVLEGISANKAQELAASVITSSADMVLESKKHPAVLRDQICSPAGTTIEGVAYLEKVGFSGTVIEAIRLMVEKANNMKK